MRTLKARFIAGLLVTVFACTAQAGELAREDRESLWQARIEALLDQGKLPLIDMESSLKEKQVHDYVPGILKTFDDLGIALMAADGYQDSKDGREGYRWSRYILDLAADYPSHFIPTANGGTNANWLKQKGGAESDFIDQMEVEIRTGQYASMGELDFRHYMSSSQCKKGKTERDSNIPLNGANGHRVFQLSANTGVAFVIHLEPEDHALDALEEMLAQYPKANVVVAHFGQIRHPESEGRFTPDYVRHLLGTYPNLYYDLATGTPNRKYKCAGADNTGVLKGDTVLWQGKPGKQVGQVSAAYRAILADFSDRFVFATDYGGGRAPLPEYLRKKHATFFTLIDGLDEAVQHNIAYRNAWRLLTGRAWYSDR